MIDSFGKIKNATKLVAVFYLYSDSFTRSTE